MNLKNNTNQKKNDRYDEMEDSVSLDDFDNLGRLKKSVDKQEKEKQTNIDVRKNESNTIN
eukprot:CAMPEP_0116979310 /NCGR_PEP_ID=MMETSP0467-20121206/58359_1 /TAXON_ID=283647 /ORGANISM="Mesodinium pulex, Strain SPMC105" /LENGTH=59 /DNA_ID=CAMNT_0004672963 /DNA_START=453 /DNA_END=632 /DNA_ORIENTATION=-